MTEFSGRLFGPGLHGSGAPTLASWQGDQLLLKPVGHGEKTVLAEQLLRAATEFNPHSRRLFWEAEQQQWALVLADQSAYQQCCDSAPSRLHTLFDLARHNRQPKRRRFAWGWTGLLALLLVPTWLGMTVFLHPGSAVGWVVEHVPLAEETRLGNLMLSQIRASSSVIEQGPVVQAIQTIGSRLTQGSAYQYRWLVVDHNDANAFAAPGGVVVVYTGLLRELESTDELAGILAHEVAHIELHHSLQAAVKNLGLHGLISLALGDYSPEIIGQLAQELVVLKFSSEAENEADADAIQRLYHAKLPMGGMVRYLERVGGEDPEHPSSALLQNHPVSAERLQTLKQAVSSVPLYVPNNATLDWAQLHQRLAPEISPIAR